MRIGPYGPFKFDPHFTFSDFSNFGQGKNGGLTSCVELSTDAQCVLDIGAHIGLVSMSVSGVLAPSGRVYSFEPGDENRKFLQTHVDLNHIGNIDVLGLVVSDENLDEIEFFVQTGDSPMNSLAVRGDGGSYKSTMKQQINLDGFCSERGLSPDVIKIDVEGAEIKVLQGAKETIGKHQPALVLSVHREEIRELGGSLEELMALIRGLGYEVFDCDNNRVLEIDTNEYILVPRPAN